MNGEIEQMCRVVCCARKALCDNKNIEIALSKYVLSIKFVFVQPFGLWRTRAVDSVQKWYRICKKRGLSDIKLIIPTEINNRQVLGFANSSRGVIVCFWKNGKVSCFCPTWNFDNQNKGWNVTYREQSNINLSKEELIYSDKTEDFKSVLLELGAFAEKIGTPNWSDVFHKAYDRMCNFSQTERVKALEHIPDEFKGIYIAVANADVFGGMGSWNDSAHYFAKAKGLEKEYDELSDRLFKQLRYHLMYISNQCWEKN